jgi:hypothetical protein
VATINLKKVVAYSQFVCNAYSAVNNNINWSEIDWSYQDSDIAELVGTSYNHIHHKRRELRMPSPTRRKKSVEELWGKVDWMYSDERIAAMLKQPISKVRYWRNTINRPLKVRANNTLDTSKNYHFKIKNPAELDWSQQDAVVAEKAGVSRERVRQLRKILGKPKPTNYRRKTPPMTISPNGKVVNGHHRMKSKNHKNKSNGKHSFIKR